MIIDSLITRVTKYFTSLSVASLWEDSKVSFVLASKRGNQIANTGDEAGAIADENILELDATESFVLSNTKKSLKHSSESYKTFVDGVKVDPLRVTIVAHLDVTKMGVLEKFSKPESWMYILHTKSMGGSIQKVGYYTLPKLYHILAVVSTDTGYKNTVQVQIELEEVVLYRKGVKYKYGVKQTNNTSGTGAAISKGSDKSWKPMFPNK